MASGCRPGTAAAALAVIGITLGLAIRGLGRVAPAEAEASGPLIGPRVRAWYRELLLPWELALAAWAVPADLLTYAQLGVSVLAGGAFWMGWMFLAGWLVIVAGSLDVLDGGLARRRGSASARGAFIDSVVDRYCEFVTFCGLGAYFRNSWLLLVVAIACFGSQVVSYTRARAEGLGLTLGLGSVQRPERYLVLGGGAVVSDLWAHLTCPLLGRPTQVVLQIVLLVLAALSVWTAVQRARYAMRELAGQGRG